MEELQILLVYDITADSPWDPKDLDDKLNPSPNFSRHNHVTKLVKVIGTEEKVDLTALVYAVHSACQVEADFPELTEE